MVKKFFITFAFVIVIILTISYFFGYQIRAYLTIKVKYAQNSHPGLYVNVLEKQIQEEHLKKARIFSTQGLSFWVPWANLIDQNTKDNASVITFENKEKVISIIKDKESLKKDYVKDKNSAEILFKNGLNSSEYEIQKAIYSVDPKKFKLLSSKENAIKYIALLGLKNVALRDYRKSVIYDLKFKGLKAFQMGDVGELEGTGTTVFLFDDQDNSYIMQFGKGVNQEEIDTILTTLTFVPV